MWLVNACEEVDLVNIALIPLFSTCVRITLADLACEVNSNVRLSLHQFSTRTLSALNIIIDFC